MDQGWIRIAELELHERLVRGIEEAAISYEIDAGKGVIFASSDRPLVMAVLNGIRDSLYPWYLVRFPTAEQSERFATRLRSAGLRSVIERQDSGTWFVLPRSDKERHESLGAEVTRGSD